MTRQQLIDELASDLRNKTNDSFAFHQATMEYSKYEYHCSEIGLRQAMLTYLTMLPREK